MDESSSQSERRPGPEAWSGAVLGAALVGSALVRGHQRAASQPAGNCESPLPKMRCCAADPQYVSEALEEFRGLRSEIINEQTMCHQINTVGITAGGLVGAVVVGANPEFVPVWLKSSILSAISILILFLIAAHQCRRDKIYRIGRYIKFVIEPHVPGLNWETSWNRLDKKHRGGAEESFLTDAGALMVLCVTFLILGMIFSAMAPGQTGAQANARIPVTKATNVQAAALLPIAGDRDLVAIVVPQDTLEAAQRAALSSVVGPASKLGDSLYIPRLNRKVPGYWVGQAFSLIALAFSLLWWIITGVANWRKRRARSSGMDCDRLECDHFFRWQSIADTSERVRRAAAAPVQPS